MKNMPLFGRILKKIKNSNFSLQNLQQKKAHPIWMRFSIYSNIYYFFFKESLIKFSMAAVIDGTFG
jgi:hypothetical protein